MKNASLPASFFNVLPLLQKFNHFHRFRIPGFMDACLLNNALFYQIYMSFLKGNYFI